MVILGMYSVCGYLDPYGRGLNNPNGSMMLYGIYLSLKVVPMSLLWAYVCVL